MKKLALLVLTLFTLSGCSWFSGMSGDGDMAKSGGGSADVETATKDAEAAIKKAASVDGKWRDTQKILKKAKAAAAKGDTADAMPNKLGIQCSTILKPAARNRATA